MKHLSIRVAWHDSKWNGSVCKFPSKNSFCLNLPRIYQQKNDQEEDALAGKHWSDLQDNQIPPCIGEGGGFMSTRKYSREFNHPYNKPRSKEIPHLALKPTTIEVLPYS